MIQQPAGELEDPFLYLPITWTAKEVLKPGEVSLTTKTKTLYCLVCCYFMSQATAMVMAEWSVHITTLF